ncbi:MAG: S-methyl-5-thioribose-1-phosphate isomerase [Candidatus Eisenbacteria bacterium]|nr:S-methyl-5-thioribose-1-phosphate isomerase [Candidatus Eisenbacteria bacterium]
MRTPETVAWTAEGIRILDQTLLPERVEYRVCRTLEEAEEAILSLRVRGAPAIGVMGAYALALALRREAPPDRVAFLEAAANLRGRIARVRPTAVNLDWALHRCGEAVSRSPETDIEKLHAVLLREAQAIENEDKELCRGIGEAGEPLVPEGGRILTHCNAGALATAGIGTALAPLYLAWERGKRFRVFADETRPLLQGARLTAWELRESGIPVTLLCDGAAPFLIATGGVDLVITGADRIARNGDFANKIGTYGVAAAAERHGVPFYVAAPSSTFDLAAPDGDSIPIEERPGEEVTGFRTVRTAPEGVEVWNPAFDRTPADLVSGFITEKGILLPPYGRSIEEALGGG